MSLNSCGICVKSRSLRILYPVSLSNSSGVRVEACDRSDVALWRWPRRLLDGMMVGEWLVAVIPVHSPLGANDAVMLCMMTLEEAERLYGAERSRSSAAVPRVPPFMYMFL